MGFLFFDDSKHPARGFSLGVFVYSAHDPSDAVREAIVDQGLDPGVDEFKSSSRMDQNPQQLALRESLGCIIRETCRLGVMVVPQETELGPQAFYLLEKMLSHEELATGTHEVFFDEGFFRSVAKADEIAAGVAPFENCEFHFEQDSKKVVGIQLSDLVAHTCSVMLAEVLGFVKKTVKVGEDSGYEPDLDIEIGFELWAGVRHAFFYERPSGRQLSEKPGPFVDVRPYGLHISDTAPATLRKAALDRFGFTYLGCIH